MSVLPHFDSLPLVANLALSTLSAAIMWIAGSRLAGYCKAISEQTRIGEPLLGTMLLGSIVSLPELTMSATAALSGNAQLAVNVLFGGIALAMLILAITDAVVGEELLSSGIVNPVVLLQGLS